MILFLRFCCAVCCFIFHSIAAAAAATASGDDDDGKDEEEMEDNPTLTLRRGAYGDMAVIVCCFLNTMCNK